MAITVINALLNHCDEQRCEVDWLKWDSEANGISFRVSVYGSLKSKEKSEL